MCSHTIASENETQMMHDTTYSMNTFPYTQVRDHKLIVHGINFIPHDKDFMKVASLLSYL